jgi:hypothetical protein
MKHFLSKFSKKQYSLKLMGVILSIRNSVCAILKIHKEAQNNFQVSIVGTGWCIESKRIIITAFHIFNNGQSRDLNDKFYALFVPDNGPHAIHTPVINFHLEDSAVDMAILELDTTPLQSIEIPAIPITFENITDGEKVITCGFPAPQIASAMVDPNGNWRGGNLFLKSYANEGIVSGQFEANGIKIYEFNIGWHHGESGGPIVRIDTLSAISIMQRYRNVQSPHGIVMGPHQGNSLKSRENQLKQFNINII